MAQSLFTTINGKSPRCVDGRPAILFIKWNGLGWVVEKRGDNALAEHGPQFLGAGLMFVKALQVHTDMNLEEAFYATEKAFASFGMTPQIHIDDHGYNFLSMNDEEIIDVVRNQYCFGCGYAGHAWQEDAEKVLRMSIDRHWRIQVLTGEHNEQGASRNHVLSKTFMTMRAVAQSKTFFNIDVAEAKLIFMALAMIEGLQDGFVDDAMSWMISEYSIVVIKLGGVNTPDGIIDIR